MDQVKMIWAALFKSSITYVVQIIVIIVTIIIVIILCFWKW